MKKTKRYSFTTIANITGDPQDYAPLLTDCYDKKGNWDPEQAKRSRKLLEKFIDRGIGDALKYGYGEEWNLKQFRKILIIFNHEWSCDNSSTHIKTIIDYIKREGRYHPYGIAWVSYTPEDINNWVRWRLAFSKDTDWRLYCALTLFQKYNADSDWFPIYTPADFDRTAGIDRSTRQRALKRLTQDGWIEWESNSQDTGFRVRICKKPRKSGSQIIPIHSQSKQKSTIPKDIDDWYIIHELLTSRQPLTERHPDFPLIYCGKTSQDLHLRLGTVSVQQMIAVVYTPAELKDIWQSLRPDSGSFHLHQRAKQEVVKAPQKMPYPTEERILDNPHIQQLIKYQHKSAFPAMDIGIPFDIHGAKKLLFRLCMAYWGRDPNPLDATMSKSSTKKRIEILQFYIQHAQQWNDRHIRPMWTIRGTQSDRTVLKDPAVQNLPKDLRFLLQNKKYKLEWYDIKGQELYIAIIEADAEQGKEDIRKHRDIMQEIADELNLHKATVKKIIHPHHRGKGQKALEEEYGQGMVDGVITAYKKRLPELDTRKVKLEQYVEEHGDRLPESPLGRTAVVIDSQRRTTCAGALMDQTIGGELTRAWALNYARTQTGNEGRIVLDMHDAIVTLVAKNETEETRQQRQEAITEALEKAKTDLRYEISPTAERKRYKGEAGRPRKKAPKKDKALMQGRQVYYCYNLEIIFTLYLLSCTLIPP